MPETSICGLTGETRVGPSPDPDPDPNPNLPPDSVRLPIRNDDAVATWLENSLNAVYERDDSAKETTNPKSNNPNPKSSRSSSHRYSTAAAAGSTNLKAEGPIIGLPARIRHVSCSASRRPPPPNTNSRIFPKKKKSVPESEPTSPKVSCFGKVLSDRERVNSKKAPHPGCWANLTAYFAACVGGGQRKRLRPKEADDDRHAAEVKPRKSNYGKAVGPAEEPPAPALPPGLGGMVRFASGRRSASWASECEFEIDREAVLARRSVGTLQDGLRD